MCASLGRHRPHGSGKPGGRACASAEAGVPRPRRVWNTLTGTAVSAVDAQSQVCALAWSRNANELVACYGAPAPRAARAPATAPGGSGTCPGQRGPWAGAAAGMARIGAVAAPGARVTARAAGDSTTAIELWRYPALTPVATLAGHTSRVLFLATSPDGQSIVTGAGAAPPGAAARPRRRAQGDSQLRAHAERAARPPPGLGDSLAPSPLHAHMRAPPGQQLLPARLCMRRGRGPPHAQARQRRGLSMRTTSVPANGKSHTAVPDCVLS